MAQGLEGTSSKTRLCQKLPSLVDVYKPEVSKHDSTQCSLQVILYTFCFTSHLVCFDIKSTVVMWGLPSAMVSAWHNKPHSPDTEIKPYEDGVRLPTWRSNWKRLHTQSSRSMQWTCTRTCTVHIPGVGAHTGWASECSAEERLNNNFVTDSATQVPVWPNG